MFNTHTPTHSYTHQYIHHKQFVVCGSSAVIWSTSLHRFENRHSRRRLRIFTLYSIIGSSIVISIGRIKWPVVCIYSVAREINTKLSLAIERRGSPRRSAFAYSDEVTALGSHSILK